MLLCPEKSIGDVFLLEIEVKGQLPSPARTSSNCPLGLRLSFTTATLGRSQLDLRVTQRLYHQHACKLHADNTLLHAREL